MMVGRIAVVNRNSSERVYEDLLEAGGRRGRCRGAGVYRHDAPLTRTPVVEPDGRDRVVVGGVQRRSKSPCVIRRKITL